MKKFFTLLLLASLLTAPNVFADGDDNNTGGNNGGNDGGNNGGDTQTPPTPPEKIPISPNPLPGNPDPGQLGPRSLSAVSGWCANGTIQLYFSGILICIIHFTNCLCLLFIQTKIIRQAIK